MNVCGELKYMLKWLLILFYYASSKHEQVLFEYVRGETDEVAVGAIDSSLEEAEPTLKEYDGSLSFPYGTNEALVGQTSPTKCSGNGIFCKCGFQDVSWIYQLLENNQDCYTLQGVCQHCGLQERIREIGFDYKFLSPQHEDVYRLRVLKEGEIWNPPRYNYQCKKTYVVTGVRSKYLRVDSLGGRDFYTLKIKCGKLKGEHDPNLRPSDWQIGSFPWLEAGEKPKCTDLGEDKCKSSTECVWKVERCKEGNPFALEALIAEAKNNPGVEKALENIVKVDSMEKEADSTKPQAWNGKGIRRELLNEEPAASINELDLGDDFHPAMQDILSEFSQYVQAPEEEDVGNENPALDPFLVSVLEQFGDSLMPDKDPQQVSVGAAEDDDAAVQKMLDSLEYYDLDNQEKAVSSSDELHPVPIGDEFFDLDSDDIISGFLREDAAIDRALDEHRKPRHSLDEVEVGDSRIDELKEQKSLLASSMAKSSQALGFGIFGLVLELGKTGLAHFEVWSYMKGLIATASTWQLISFGLFCFVLCGMTLYFCFRKSGDRFRSDYNWLQSEEEMEF